MVIAAILFLAIFLPNHKTVWLVVIIAGLAILLQTFDTFDCFFQARGQMKSSFIGRTIPILLAATLKVAAVLAGATVVTFAALEAAEAALISAGLAIVYRKHSRTTIATTPSASGSSSGTMLYNSLPLLISAVAVMIYLRSDLIMLGMMIGSKTTGIYSAAAQVSEIWNVIPLAIAPAVFPMILCAKKNGLEAYNRHFLIVLQSISFVAILIACFVTIGAPFIVNVLYGPAFAEAGGILRLHIWSIVFVFFGMIQTLWDAGEKLYWLTCIRTVFGAFCNVSLNLLLIPKYGASGAAFATVTSYAFAGFLLNASTRRTFPLFIMQLKALCLVPLIRWCRRDQWFRSKPGYSVTANLSSALPQRRKEDRIDKRVHIEAMCELSPTVEYRGQHFALDPRQFSS